MAATNGEWLVKVFFTGAPVGEPFTVTVSDSEGHVKTFEFTSYADK